MESDGEPYSQFISTLLLQSSAIEPGTLLLQVLLLLVLLYISALVSGAEVAFFSLKGEALSELKSSESSVDKTIVKLLNRPKRLLATILITNNIVNISVIILSTSVTAGLLKVESEALAFFVQVVAVTFLLVLFGEVTPKIYAQHRNMRLARLVARPMDFLTRLLWIPSQVLVRSSTFFEDRISKYQSELSREELNEAIELTSDEETSPEEKNILKGIVNFGDIMVKQIMKPRQAVVAYPNTLAFDELKSQINEHRFSRLPIYEGDIDKVVGILHVKDLLPYLDQNDDFDWVSLTRKPYFVPEMKQIDDLLSDFQTKKIHMAVVVDEYGGTEGVATLEDVLEEIVGEIHDEFDDTEVFYSKLDDDVVVFDGKTSLSDVQKVMKLEPEAFEDYKALVDSIGGLATEVHGKVPSTGELIHIKGFELKVELADRKRVKRIKLTRLEEDDDQVASMDNSKELREKKALSRLFKLTVIGSVLIVVVYSVYYYSNAHKYTRSNIIRASETKSTLVNVSMDTVVAKENLVFSDNLHFAKVNALNGWKYQGASSLGFTQNLRTTVGLSGLMENGFFEAFNAEMKRHFHSIPPIDIDRNKPGMVVKSIQFEHFVFPYHAMIRWDRRPGVKTFSFYKDSIKGTFLALPGNGFSWLPDQGESRLYVQPCKEGDSMAALVDAMFNTKGTSVDEPEVVRMPIVDFDLLYTERKPPVFKRNGEVQRAATSTGEVKLLIGPSLKQGNVYEVDTSRTLLDIKPPFIVALTKEAESKPYFIALIANEELLLK